MDNEFMKEAELDEVAGGIEMNRKTPNNKCPKCGRIIPITTEARIEGIGNRVIYTCEPCRIRWIAGNSYNGARPKYYMISYDDELEVHQDLGLFEG